MKRGRPAFARKFASGYVEHDPEQKIRCLLTVWGVPLKIGPAEADDQSREYEQFLTAERAHRLKLLNVLQQSLDQIAPESGIAEISGTDELEGQTGNGAEGPAARSSSWGGRRLGRLAARRQTPAVNPRPVPILKRRPNRSLSRLALGWKSPCKRLKPGSPSWLPATRAAVRQSSCNNLPPRRAGPTSFCKGSINRLLQIPTSPPAARSEFDALRGRAAAFLEVRFLMEQTPPSIERDAMVLAILERIGGLLGSVEWLDEQLKVVTQNESGASFDSELALVMWPDDYQLLRWQPNYLRPNYENSQLPKVYRTFMVARLDAPTLMLAKGLVDTAIKVEAEGLRGKVYIDGRGIAKLEDANHIPGSYGDYDRALLITAKGIEEQTELEVVLDTSPQLFQAGACPDAALYCGWYSLAKYVDAFDWKPGAVAYHLASSEAHTLRDPGSQAWCKKLIEDGVCATIGPVYEPYLGSFPRPNEFFALLLRGDLTLVECYARTTPYNSWMMTLIGDPLYRPFKYRVGAKAPAESSPPSNGQPPTTSATPGN